MQIWYVFVMIYFYRCIKYWGIGYEIPIICRMDWVKFLWDNQILVNCI